MTVVFGYIAYADSFGMTRMGYHKFYDDETCEAVRYCAEWLLEQENKISLNKEVEIEWPPNHRLFM